MKRLLLSVFAAAITAAFVAPAPATAADINLSGQYRLRGEFRDNADFSSAATDNTSSYGQRVRLTAKAQATDDTSVKITLQDTRSWGANQTAAGGPGLTDVGSNHLDLHESYVNVKDVFGTGVAATIGRQELIMGDQRLVGAFGWHNNARSFDAFRFDYGTDPVDLLFVASKINENTTTDNDQDLYVINATIKAIPNNTLDVYLINLRDGSTTAAIGSNTTVAGTINSVQTIYNLGARLKGSLDFGLDYTAEINSQTGGFDTTTSTYDVGGLAYALRANYKLPTAMKAKVGVEYAYASGDSNGSDGDMETFFNLFPTNHLHYGFADRHGWRNLSAWNINGSLQATDQLTLKASFWGFKLAEKEDAWYGAGTWNTTQTGTFAANSANVEDQVGTELDLIANYKYNSALSAQLGYARYFAGDYIESVVGAGNAEDSDWAYLMLTANF